MDTEAVLLMFGAIASVAGLTASVLAFRVHRYVREIDHAVNGQDPGTPPLVEKVANIVAEQLRVKHELTELKDEEASE